MRKPRGVQNHEHAPAAWRRTSNITGDYDLDASILHCKNKSVPEKLKTHVLSGSGAYGPHRYNGYSGYKGDD